MSEPLFTNAGSENVEITIDATPLLYALKDLSAFAEAGDLLAEEVQLLLSFLNSGDELFCIKSGLDTTARASECLIVLHPSNGLADLHAAVRARNV